MMQINIITPTTEMLHNILSYIYICVCVCVCMYIRHYIRIITEHTEINVNVLFFIFIRNYDFKFLIKTSIILFHIIELSIWK